jgi:hypothetical protein
MDIEPKEQSIFYVYILYRDDGVTPFYVGKGKGSRLTHHERWAKNGRSYKDNIICEMRERGIRVPVKKVAENLTEQAAFNLETELIAQFGRYPNGPLANLTDGGDGVPALSVDTRILMGKRSGDARRGKQLSEAHRENVSAARRGAVFSDQHKANLSAARAKVTISQETREALSRAMKGRVMSEEHRAKLSATAKRRMQDPEQLQALLNAAKGKNRTPEAIEKNRAWHTGKKASPETLAKRSASMKLVWDRRKAMTEGSADG